MLIFYFFLYSIQTKQIMEIILRIIFEKKEIETLVTELAICVANKN